KEDPMPKTPCVKTGGGGRHLYFKWSPAVEIKNRAKVASLSIDVRGTGGYVLAPPSNHKSGNLYEWEDSSAETTLAEAPEWVIAFVQSKSPAAPALDPNEALFAQMTAAADLRTAPGVAEGSRHTRACELIGAHLGRGENPIVVLDLAFEWGKR